MTLLKSLLVSTSLQCLLAVSHTAMTSQRVVLPALLRIHGAVRFEALGFSWTPPLKIDPFAAATEALPVDDRLPSWLLQLRLSPQLRVSPDKREVPLLYSTVLLLTQFRDHRYTSSVAHTKPTVHCTREISSEDQLERSIDLRSPPPQSLSPAMLRSALQASSVSPMLFAGVILSESHA